MYTMIALKAIAFVIGCLWALAPFDAFPRRLPSGRDLRAASYGRLLSIVARGARGTVVMLAALVAVAGAPRAAAPLLLWASLAATACIAVMLTGVARADRVVLRWVERTATVAAWGTSVAGTLAVVDGLRHLQDGMLLVAVGALAIATAQVLFVIEGAVGDLRLVGR